MTHDELQEHIRSKIEFALRDRSWNWLAETSGVPQATLNEQKLKRRFKLDVLLKVSRVLRRPIGYFLPDEHAGFGDSIAMEAFYQLAEVVDRTRGIREARDRADSAGSDEARRALAVLIAEFRTQDPASSVEEAADALWPTFRAAVLGAVRDRETPDGADARTSDAT